METHMRSLLLALALLLPASAFADSKLSLPKVDDEIKAVGIVQLRASSPDPTFGGKGAQIGWLKAGEAAKILSVKHYISIFGTEVWVEVEKKSDPNAKGWIFAGLAKDISKGHASIVSVDSVESPEAAAARVAAANSARSDELIENEE